MIGLWCLPLIPFIPSIIKELPYKDWEICKQGYLKPQVQDALDELPRKLLIKE